MCIRDRILSLLASGIGQVNSLPLDVLSLADSEALGLFASCLLYTSDAADERSSVDLGGRRIIKKKKRAITLSVRCKNTK